MEVVIAMESNWVLSGRVLLWTRMSRGSSSEHGVRMGLIRMPPATKRITFGTSMSLKIAFVLDFLILVILTSDFKLSSLENLEAYFLLYLSKLKFSVFRDFLLDFDFLGYQREVNLVFFTFLCEVSNIFASVLLFS